LIHARFRVGGSGRRFLVVAFIDDFDDAVGTGHHVGGDGFGRRVGLTGRRRRLVGDAAQVAVLGV
jgi:hypothetical protein